MILDGKLVANKLLKEVKEEIILSKNEPPSIAIVLVGNNPASESYVSFKIKACKDAGIDTKIIRFEESVSNETLLSEITTLNNSEFTGFIVQLPLPKHINVDSIISHIDPKKDIDGFHPDNFGKISLGQKAMRPATAYGILKLLQYYEIKTKGKHVVVIGRSNIVGKPLAIMLGNDFDIGRATVTSCDINTPPKLLKKLTLIADIVIVAVGKPNLLTADMVKDGAVVVDVGINKIGNKMVGDADFENLKNKCSWITPVPGGVGPMTITGLILNTLYAWKILHK
jgi:methylenetetrahydrofolate dehydrogenase (NADP+)/methenyltetrahydrofolate cyclohydrolase